jgi:hypothetical protein
MIYLCRHGHLTEVIEPRTSRNDVFCKHCNKLISKCDVAGMFARVKGLLYIRNDRISKANTIKSREYNNAYYHKHRDTIRTRANARYHSRKKAEKENGSLI